jgi:hypothetical protein
MPQKRGEVIEKVDTAQVVPDIYESWLKKQIEARPEVVEDAEEDEIDKAEDVHEKAHRRKRGKTSH